MYGFFSARSANMGGAMFFLFDVIVIFAIFKVSSKLKKFGCSWPKVL